MTTRRLLPAVLLFPTTLAVATAAPAARGGLITRIAYDQNLSASTQLFSNGGASATLVGTALPVSQTIAVAEPVGLPTPLASATASYSFTDDGTTASLSINCQGQINGPYSNLGESTSTNPSVGTFVTFAQPVAYTASISITGMRYANLTLNVGTMSPALPQLAVGSVGPMQAQLTGTVPAGVPIYIADHWDLDNGIQSNPPPLSGTYSLSIVFTAVPEPAAAGLAGAIAGVALQSRRRRRGRAR